MRIRPCVFAHAYSPMRIRPCVFDKVQRRETMMT
jgi:hypothetical protein